MLTLPTRIVNKKHLMLLLKVILAATLIGFLLINGSLDFRSISAIAGQLGLFLPALLCLFAGIVISGVRWWILLWVSGNKIHLSTVLSLQLIGSFFSTWLPGAAGGDAVRAIHIFRLLENRRSTALLSIITDRIYALVGLISIAGLISLFLPAKLAQSAAMISYIGLVKILALGAAAVLVLVLFSIWLVLQFSLLEYVPIKVRGYLNTIVETFLIYKRKWAALVLCWVISVLASGIVVIGIVLIAEIFPYAAEPLVSAIAGVFGNVFSAIPVTPGGLGVGEAIFGKICAELSLRVAPFATIYFAFRVGMLIANTPGMIIYLFFNHSKHREMACARFET